MMHPQFFEMVEYAAHRNISVTTNTNLTLLTPIRARRLVRSGAHRIFVSIDGATADTYETIRVGSDFKLVLRNLKILIQNCREFGAGAPAVKIVMVLMRKNLAELPDMVRLVSGCGAEGLSVQHLCHDFAESSLPAHYEPMRNFVDEQTLLSEDPEVVHRTFDAARTAAAEVGLDLHLPNLHPIEHPSGTPGRKRCDWPWRGAYVSYDGKAMPCCMVATPDRINFGSVFESRPEDIWEGKPYEEFRDRLSSDDPPEVCKSCAVYRGTF
jgi:radical SAM protein with 4Fe4S-binding SPASM domain